MIKSPNRLLGTVFGAVYILVGLLGFTVTKGVGFFTTEGGLLLGLFEVNTFHNVAHILIGAALLLAGLSTVKAARAVNSTIGFAYLALGFAGLLLVGSALNILALNAADNVLHFASAVVLLAAGLGADKRATDVSASVAVIPFSQALRERTWSSHGDSEGADFMKDLMTGKGNRDDYIALVAQHYFIYEAIEAAAEHFAADPVAAPFITSQLTRLPAIEADLKFLIGADWREQIAPLPTAAAYAARVREISAQDWAGGFIAHHYTRYLGDLSGGQVIRTLMQRQFGFETNGVGFYLFDQIAKPTEFKNTYREQLDAVEWDDAERERVIDEVVAAYKFNTDLFVDLSRAKAAA